MLLGKPQDYGCSLHTHTTNTLKLCVCDKKKFGPFFSRVGSSKVVFPGRSVNMKREQEVSERDVNTGLCSVPFSLTQNHPWPSSWPASGSVVTFTARFAQLEVILCKRTETILGSCNQAQQILFDDQTM